MSVEVRFAGIASELAHRSDNRLAFDSCGDWCPIFYSAEARREVALELVADWEVTDDRAVGDITVTAATFAGRAAGRRPPATPQRRALASGQLDRSDAERGSEGS
jgi:hypothetical protein